MTEPSSSNPFDLDKEAIESLNELLEELLDSSNGAIGHTQFNKLIKARFLSANGRNFYFDIGEKKDGICPSNEFFKTPTVGEEFSVLVLKEPHKDGTALLSKKDADRRIVWESIQEAHKSVTNLSGKISRVLPAGYLITYEGVELFMPLSLSSLNLSATKRYAQGAEIDFRVVELKEKFFSAIVSHRAVVAERNDALWDQFTEQYKEEDIVEGVVVKKVSFGVFFEVEGLIALLHSNDISWRKSFSFKSKFHLKNKMQLKILKMDRENNHIGLGLKQLKEEPWEWAKRELSIGQKITGFVTSVTQYGAFLEVYEGLEGLLHQNDMSWERKKKDTKDYVMQGQSIDVQITVIDIENHRISFSLKELEESPWSKMKKAIKEGDVLLGKVKGVTDFGTFVEVCNGIEGLIHCKDYNWDSSPKKDMFRKGQKIQFKVLEIDSKKERISCGFRQLTDSPHVLFKKEYPKGTVVSGKIKRIAPFGLVISLPKKMEGTVSPYETGLERGVRIESKFTLGEEIRGVIQDVDLSKRRIYISIKGYDRIRENEISKKYIQSHHTPASYNPFADLLAHTNTKKD